MCCIFTCFGWMLDLFQRAWVFFMSCFISSAVCCSFITASMSGVALGYNYSLAEYIELKETNVSVFLKRGVFDDEVVNEMDWRRSGGGLPAAQLRSGELTEAPASVSDFPHGFRKANDEGMFSSSTPMDEPNNLYGHEPDHNRFEGSLLKLTAMPIARGGQVTEDRELAKIMTEYPPESLDQIKAIQGLLNRRKMNQYDESKGANPMVGTASSNQIDEMNVIKKLLGDRKMAAMKFDHMKQTKRPSKPDLTGVIPAEVFPYNMLGGSARRMGDSGSVKPAGTDMIKDLEGGLQTLLQDPSKWYFVKQPTPPDNPLLASPTYYGKGPITLRHTATMPRIIKLETVAPLAQDDFRRAMLEDTTAKHVYQTVTRTPLIREPEKDYDEEDVKGIPIRKKRKKRNRRHIAESQTDKETKEDKSYTDNVPLNTGTGLFSKLMNALMNFKMILAPDDMDSKVLHEATSSKTLLKASNEISSVNIVTSSYVGASLSQSMGLSNIIKSTVASF